MKHFLNPKNLGIIPPMDLSLGDPQFISPFPMKLRIYNNSLPRVGSVGLFGARRNVKNNFIRLHEGVDLIAPKGTKIFAVQDGAITAINAKNTALRMEHTKGFRYSTYYSHLQNIKVIKGQTVKQGEQIAEVGDFTASDKHLHFEICYPFDRNTTNNSSTLRVDPTWALYEWEKKRYTNDVTSRNTITVDANNFKEFSEIVRGRLLRFIKIKIQNVNHDIYLPFNENDHHDKFMAETLRTLFINKGKAEITWRESLFFNQLEHNHNKNDKVAILVEVKLVR